MSEPQHTRSASAGALLPAYRWLATLFVVLIVLQAWLGSSGAFQGEDWMTTGHGHLANGMFALIVVQTVIAWVLYTRGVLSTRAVAFNAALVALTVAQIGLGYSTRNGERWADTVSLHIPNGVLLMGLATAVAALAWQLREADAPRHDTAPRATSTRGA